MANGKRPRCEYHTSPYLSIVQARVMKGNDLALGVMRTKRCGAGPRDRAGLQSCGTRWRQGEGNRSERVVGLGVCHVFQDAVTRILIFVTVFGELLDDTNFPELQDCAGRPGHQRSMRCSRFSSATVSSKWYHGHYSWVY